MKLTGTSVDVKRSISLAPQPLLQFQQRNRAPVAPADDFAIENEIAGDFAKRSGQLWKFGDAIEGAGIHLDGVAAFVNLRANAVEFFFDERTGGKHFDEFRRRIDRTREHARDWPK